MKRLLLLLIPLLFTSCSFFEKKEYGDFVFYNEVDFHVLFQLSSDYDTVREMTIYKNEGYKFTNYPIKCKYTIKIKNKKKPLDDWTTFIFYPCANNTHYYILGNETKIIMTSSNNKESPKIQRIPPSTE